MNSDIRDALERYKEEYKEVKREIALAITNNASDEEIKRLRNKMYNLLFRIQVLEHDVYSIGGKQK